jgi:hypothetical protein
MDSVGTVAILNILTPTRMATLLALTAILVLLIADRRLALIPLLTQYVLIGLLIGAQLYRPIVLVRIMLGLAVCLILYLSARHHSARVISGASWAWGGGGASSVFRLFVGLLGLLIAYGLWRSYPWASIPTTVNLVSYLLMVIGLLAVLISSEPLRIGLGLLMFVNGFETMYFFLEQSFVVIGMLGSMQILLALAVAHFTEIWLGESPAWEDAE